MLCVSGPIREGIIVERTTTTFQPRQIAGLSWFEGFEPHRLPGFALDEDGSRTEASAAEDPAEGITQAS